MPKSLKNVSFENSSGFEPDFRRCIDVLPKRHTEVLENEVAGEAPKDFIRVYEYGRSSRKRNKKSWIPYIAKFARKWYPNESITEHLMNRIGYGLGVRMANSKLVLDEEFGRLRFLSEYFLKSGERLEHGAEIFGGYLSNHEMVDEIERDRKNVRNLFTFQFAECAIKHRYGHGTITENLLTEWVKMLCFDAITGNNDRHSYNWGVISDLENKKAPKLAPVYDSARGLFWNEHEDSLSRFYDGKDRLVKYLNGACPRIGWENLKSPNHFQLMKLIYDERPEFRFVVNEMLDTAREDVVTQILEKEFKELFSQSRYRLIKTCLNLRFETLRSTLTLNKHSI